MQYHIHIAVETLSGANRLKTSFNSLQSDSICWDGYRVFEEETADGLTHLSFTIPVTNRASAESLRYNLERIVDRVDHFGSTAQIRSVDTEGTPEIAGAVA